MNFYVSTLPRLVDESLSVKRRISIINNIGYMPLAQGVIAKLELQSSWLVVSIVTRAGIVISESFKYNDYFDRPEQETYGGGSAKASAEIGYSADGTTKWKSFEPTAADLDNLRSAVNELLTIYSLL